MKRFDREILSVLMTYRRNRGRGFVSSNDLEKKNTEMGFFGGNNLQKTRDEEGGRGTEMENNERLQEKGRWQEGRVTMTFFVSCNDFQEIY